MTIPDSTLMMDNEASCLPIPPEEERRIVEELTNKSDAHLKEGNGYYVISNRWYSSWQRYVTQSSIPINEKSLDSESPDLTSTETDNKPGPIDNSDIIFNCNNREGDDLELHRSLEEVKDYVLVPQEVWEKLFSWQDGPLILYLENNNGIAAILLSQCHGEPEESLSGADIAMYVSQIMTPFRSPVVKMEEDENGFSKDFDEPSDSSGDNPEHNNDEMMDSDGEDSSSDRYLKNKLDTLVSFPIHNLDLTRYVKGKDGEPYIYELYAISNHYGSLFWRALHCICQGKHHQQSTFPSLGLEKK